MFALGCPLLMIVITTMIEWMEVGQYQHLQESSRGEGAHAWRLSRCHALARARALARALLDAPRLEDLQEVAPVTVWHAGRWVEPQMRG